MDILKKFDERYSELLKTLDIADAVINRDGIIAVFAKSFIKSEVEEMLMEMVNKSDIGSMLHANSIIIIAKKYGFDLTKK